MTRGALQPIAEMRAWDDEIEERDWEPGGPQGRNIAAKAHGRAIPYLRVIADPHTPCWLCEPGYVCAFHREDETS